MLKVIEVWAANEEEISHIENNVFPKELIDKLNAAGLRIAFGIGTFLRGLDVHVESKDIKDKSDPLWFAMQFTNTILVAEGYRIFNLRPSIDKMVAEVLSWWNALSPEARVASRLLEAEEDDLIEYHHTLGQDIRNSFQLWSYTWYPEIVNGVDESPEHPDQVSARVIREVWRHLKETEDAWNA